MFRDLTPEEIPPWIKGKPLSGQSPATQKFWRRELRRIKFGVVVDGVEFHPAMYFYLNHWWVKIDRKNSGGAQFASLPHLRDNEWIINCKLLEAEKNGTGLMLLGCRRFGKSYWEAAYIAHSAIINKGSDNLIMGGEQGDLDTLKNNIDYGWERLHPFLRHQKITQDWAKGVEFGTRNVDSSKNIFSRIVVRNVEAGKRGGSQKAANLTASRMVIDEFGKHDMSLAWEAALPTIMADYGPRSPFMLTGTSGNIESISAAKRYFLNPELNRLEPMDWGLLNDHAGEDKTWKEIGCCIFIPGQMAIDPLNGEKIETNLADYLRKDGENLKKIKIYVTDWKKATKNQKEHLAKLEQSDKQKYVEHRMFYPLDPTDCFLDVYLNPFPVPDIEEHMRDIIARGDTGACKEFNLREKFPTTLHFSKKQPVTQFPFQGGIADAPILIFEDPPAVPRFDDTYAAGFDGYKTTVSTGSSLGSFYIVKRMVNIFDHNAYCFVCSYTARPEHPNDFYKTCESLLEIYGARCLMEGIDMGFEQWLRARGKDWRLLVGGVEVAKKTFNPNAEQANLYGLSPTGPNKEYILKANITYSRDKIGEKEVLLSDGTTKIESLLGVTRVRDVGWLQEAAAFRPGLNTDRLTASGHALALARYYDTMGILPKTEEDYRREEEIAKNIKKHTPAKVRVFGKRRAVPIYK
jgi:hypothetical protein